MFVYISLLLQISMLEAGWSSRLCPRVTSSLRTFSSSPCNVPFFISAQPYLMVTQNVNNLPVKLNPNENCTQEQDISDEIDQKTVEIEEQDIKIDVEESTTIVETVLADENETNIEEESTEDIEEVALQDNLEYTENIDDSELKNMPPTADLLVDSGLSNLD